MEIRKTSENLEKSWLNSNINSITIGNPTNNQRMNTYLGCVKRFISEPNLRKVMSSLGWGLLNIVATWWIIFDMKSDAFSTPAMPIIILTISGVSIVVIFNTLLMVYNIRFLFRSLFNLTPKCKPNETT